MMSIVRPLVTDPPMAVRTGADLRDARERLGLSLPDVAASLRIRLPHLEALEQGRVSLLPGNAYALAFLRGYANALGLDADEMVRRFKTETGEGNRRVELVFPVPTPQRGLPAGAVLLLAVLFAIGTYAGWYHLSGEGRLPAETVAAIPQRLASLAEQALPQAAGLSVAGAPAPGAGAEPPAAAPAIALAEPTTAETPADPAPPVAPISPTSAAAAQLPRLPADDKPAADLSPAPDATRMLLRATADAWLMVKDHGGVVLLNRTLKAGETWPVPVRADLLLTTGNAGGTEIILDGAATPSLGGNGAVRRDVPLDPDQIKDGRLAASAMPPLASARPRQ